MCLTALQTEDCYEIEGTGTDMKLLAENLSPGILDFILGLQSRL